MADNVAITAGSGTDVATDQVSGTLEHVQLVKLAISTDGSRTLVPSDGTAGMKVDLGTDNDVTVTGTVTANAGTNLNTSALATEAGNIANVKTAVELIDDIVKTLGTDTYAETTTKGAVIGAVRTDTQATLVNTTNEIGPLQMNASGALRVEVSNGTTAQPAMAAAASRGYVQLTDGTTNAGVIAGTTALKTDVSSIAGTAASVGAGANGNGVQRVTLATDQTAVSTAGVFSVKIDQTTPGTTNAVAALGPAAHDAAISGNPVRLAGRALTSDYTAVATGDTADLITTTTGKLVNMPFAIPARTWQYAGPSGGITDTADDAVKAAGTGAERHYITHIDVINGHATVSTDVQLKDGTTVIHRGFAQAAGGGYSIDFQVPLRGTAATAVNVACGTTGSATYVNVTGFTAAE